MKKYIIKQSIFFLFSLLLIPACGKKVERESISLGKTVKISYSSQEIIVDDVSYEWYFLAKPKGSRAFLLVDNDKALFNPDKTGEYDILVSVMDQYGKEIDKKGYYYDVVTGDAEAEPPAQDTTQTETAQEEAPVEKPVPSAEPPAEAEKPAEVTPAETEVEEKIPDSTIVTPTPEEPEPLPTEIEQPAVEKVSTPTAVETLSADAYAVQVSAWKTRRYALREVQRLEAQGFDAHIEMYFDVAKDLLWYRVRLGEYAEYSSAVKVLAMINALPDFEGIIIPIYNEKP